MVIPFKTAKKGKSHLHHHHANDATLNTTYTYQKPSKYEDFVAELISACKSGDNDSKKLMQELVPHLAHKLRESKQWEKPSHCLEFY